MFTKWFMCEFLTRVVIPTETGIIVLIDDTPEVMQEDGGLLSVRVRFSRNTDVANVECALLELVSPQNCKQKMMFCELYVINLVNVSGNSGEFTFNGLPTGRRDPLFLEITAFDQSGQQVAIISRPVRLGTCHNIK